MSLPPPCTAVPNLEMSLSLSGRKSEQDPAGSPGTAHWAENRWICLLFRNWLLFHLLSAATPPYGWGHLMLMSLWKRKGRKPFTEENTFLCTLATAAPGWTMTEAQMTIWPKGTSSLSLAYYKENWESTYILSWFLKKENKTVNLDSCFSHCLLLDEIE